MQGSERVIYLIARGRSASAHDWNQPYITYIPPDTECEVPRIGSYDNHTPHSNGGESSPRDILDRSMLRSMIEDLGGTWFLPFVRRMADGENVPMDEIAASYLKQHGTPIESKPYGARYFQSEQAAYDWAIANPSLERCLVNIISIAAGIANANWTEWLRSKAQSLHYGMEAYYLGEPPVAVIVDTSHREFLNECHLAYRAAARECVMTRDAKLAALAAPNIRALGKESYQSLFGHLR